MVGVSDGDTITVLDDSKTQHKVRFAGIDAPEKGQAFGERSKQSLSALVFQKRVEARCHKKDRYGREVCAVFVGLRDVGLEQICAGMAWHYKAYQHEQPTQERLVYAQEEENARASGVGLWKYAKPVPPWDWRKKSIRERRATISRRRNPTRELRDPGARSLQRRRPECPA